MSRYIKCCIVNLLILVTISSNSHAFSALNIRFGQYEDFSRVIFDLHNLVPYKILTEDVSDSIHIAFEGMSKLPNKDLWESKKTLIHYIRFTKQKDHIKAEISLRSPGHVKRHFVLEKPYRLVLDISKPDKKAEKPNHTSDVELSQHKKSDLIDNEKANIEEHKVSLDHPLIVSEEENRVRPIQKGFKEKNVILSTTLSEEELLAKSEYEWLLGEYDSALLSYKTFLLRFPQHEHNHLIAARVAEIMRKQKQYRQALDAYANVVMRYPNSEGSRFSQIRMAELQLEYPNLIPLSMARNEKRYLPFYAPVATLKRLIQTYPDHHLSDVARYTTGLILLGRQEAVKAFEVFNHLLSRNLTEPLRSQVLIKLRDSLGGLLKFHVSQENYFEALSIYFEMKDILRPIDRISTDLILPVVESYENLGLLEESEQLLNSLMRSGILKSPILNEAVIKKVEILVKLEKYSEARTLLKQVGQVPNQSFILRLEKLLSKTEFLNGNPEEIDHYLQEIGDVGEERAQRAKIYMRLGGAFEKKALLDQALKSYQKCIQLGQGEASSYLPHTDVCVFRAGLIDAEKSKHAQALKHFELLLSAFQSSQYRDQVLFRMANIYQEMDNQSKMIETLRLLKEKATSPLWKKMAVDTLEGIRWRKGYYQQISNF